jgi:hypothetical protein
MSHPAEPAIQHHDRLHVQSEAPHPGIQPFETPAQEAVEDYAAVRVHVTNPVKTTTGATQFGVYQTIVIPASGNGQVLPHDPLRQYAYILSVDFDVVITTTLEASQAPNNQVASVPNPSGGYLPKGMFTPAIRHNDPVYVANTSTASPTRVVILVERGSTE